MNHIIIKQLPAQPKYSPFHSSRHQKVQGTPVFARQMDYLQKELYSSFQINYSWCTTRNELAEHDFGFYCELREKGLLNKLFRE